MRLALTISLSALLLVLSLSSPLFLLVSASRGPPPEDLAQLECALHAQALNLAAKICPQGNLKTVADALRLQHCENASALFSHSLQIQTEERAQRKSLSDSAITAETTVIHVDANKGSDSDGDGSAAKPFRSLPTAQTAARKALLAMARSRPAAANDLASSAMARSRPAAAHGVPASVANTPPQTTASDASVIVEIHAGRYLLTETLMLDSRDNGSVYRAAANETRPVVSGAIEVPASKFQPVAGRPGLLSAHVQLPSGLENIQATAKMTKGGVECDSPSDDCALQQNTDLAGNDLQTTTAASPSDCCSKCKAFKGCKFFTIEHAEGGTCWLKSSDAGRRSYADHVSGQPGGGPPPPPPPPPPPFTFGPSPPPINQLFVGGVRQVRARYPNGNPQDATGICFSKMQYPDEACRGYLGAEGSYGPNLPSPEAAVSVSSDLNRGKSPTRGCSQCTTYGTFKYNIYPPPEGHPVYNKPLPGVGWSNTSVFSFWASPFSRPGGFVNKELAARAAANWSSAEDGIVHMFHGGLWGGWQYQLNGMDASANAFTFGYGGYQEARGSGISSNHFYVENIFEELDSPGEWWYNRSSSQLFLMPNGTLGSDTIIAIPVLETLVAINGSAGNPAKDIHWEGVEFTETKSTFLQQYEVSSGGDWSIHRGGAVYVESAEGITIADCVFNQTGGNALIFSNHVENSSATGNVFSMIGDSGIVLLGSTSGIDATQATFPFKTLIANNFIHEIGIYGKQTSCIAHSLAANSTIVGNVCFNGPRAGFNFNDGFYGRNWLENNLIFNMVRETGDHGPFNSWDRQPYLTKNGVDDGFSSKDRPAGTSILKAEDVITRNMIINGYNGVWTIDHDDGSQFFNDTNNVMMFGGCKNYLGNSKYCQDNLILYPGIDSRATGDRKCQTDDNGVFANQYFINNTCITDDGVPYTWGSCGVPIDLHTFFTQNNSFYAPNANFTTVCGSKTYDTLQKWQATGRDADSTTHDSLSIDDIVSRARHILGLD